MLFDGVFREQVKWNFHILVSVEWCANIYILNIDAHVFFSIGYEYAVSLDIGGGKIVS